MARPGKARTRRQRAWRWTLLAIAVVAALTGAAPALATFTVQSNPQYTAVTFGTPQLSAPTMNGTCTWNSSTQLTIGWTANSSWASGVEVQRNDNGGSFADDSAVTPIGTTSYQEAPSTPTSHTYGYEVLATVGTNWRSSASTAIYSNTCIGTISTPAIATPGTVPKLNAPEQIVWDTNGDAFIADTGNHCIREIAGVTSTQYGQSMTAGNLYTAVGNCTSSGSTGDGGSSTSATAKLNTPEAVAVDSSGNLYIADTNNSTIRMVTAAGTLATIAGSAGTTNSTDGTGNLARFDHPAGIVVTSGGDLYITDRQNDTLRKLHCTASCPSTTNTNWTASTPLGTAGVTTNDLTHFNLPEELAIDGANNIWVADKSHNKVRKITGAPNALTMSEFAGSGTSGHVDNATPTSGQLNSPTGVAVDTNGDVYIADGAGKWIRKVANAGALSTIGGNGSNGYSGDGYGISDSMISAAHGVGVRSGVPYIVDTGNNLVREIVTEGSQENIIISVTGDAGAATSGFAGNGATAWDGPALGQPSGIAIDTSGNVFIADAGTNRVRELVASTGDVVTVAGTGVSGTNGDGGDARLAKLAAPRGVAVDSSGNLYIADTGNHAIRKVTNPTLSTATITTVAGQLGAVCTVQPCGDGGAATSAKLNTPYDVVVDGSGNLYVADTNINGIRKVVQGGNITDWAGDANGTAGYVNGTGSAAQFTTPYALTIDGSGNIYVADTGNNRIRKITTGQVVSLIAGNGTAGFADNATGASAQFSSPRGIFVDGTSLYVGDNSNSRLRKVTLSGVFPVTTLAGTGTATSTGDNGPALAATINGPWGVTDVAGDDVYVADSGTGNIRKILGPQ